MNSRRRGAFKPAKPRLQKAPGHASPAKGIPFRRASTPARRGQSHQSPSAIAGKGVPHLIRQSQRRPNSPDDSAPGHEEVRGKGETAGRENTLPLVEAFDRHSPARCRRRSSFCVRLARTLQHPKYSRLHLPNLALSGRKGPRHLPEAAQALNHGGRTFHRRGPPTVLMASQPSIGVPSVVSPVRQASSSPQTISVSCCRK